MPDESPSKPRGSCFGKLISLLTLAGMASLGVAVWFMWQPQDLSDVQGVGAAAATKRSPDLLTAMKNSIKGGYAMTIHEEDLNLYLKQVIQPRQDGALGKFVTLEGVCVRLMDDQAEVILQRKVFGKPVTTSMYLQLEQTVGLNGGLDRQLVPHGAPYLKDLPRPIYRGGRFGRVEVPQGFLLLVLPSFSKLGSSLMPEFNEGILEMGRITLKKGKLVLDPGDGSSQMGFPGAHPPR